MAWNEPGGNGKQRDPWGGDQGPPDLDEAFRKFREKLGGALGGGGTGAARFNSGVIGLVRLLIFGVWFYLGLYVIDEQERILLFNVDDGVALHHNRPELINYWITPGGGVDPGETFEAAALRELWRMAQPDPRTKAEAAALAKLDLKAKSAW